jgi:FkbM family methyltransferase
VVPFYDTNIGNVMKQTSAMNLVQSYEMQSILMPGDVFVDAGANLGSYTVALAERVGASGMVFAFEPFRWLFQILNANIALNGLMNVWAFQLALGEAVSRKTLLQPNLRFFSSPGGVRVEKQLEVSEETKKQLYDAEWGAETVDTWTLDEVIFGSSYFSARNRNAQVDLVKIDVEGMELAVVNGALRVMRELRPIVWAENVDFFESKNPQFLNLMASLDYRCWKSLNAGNDLICEPVSGERSARLSRVSKTAL